MEKQQTANGVANKSNKTVSVSARVIEEGFSVLVFESSWREAFTKYHDTHVMQDVRDKLKQGMDPVSAEYVEHHDILVNISRGKYSVLVSKDLAWTKTDRELFARYYQAKKAGTDPMLGFVDIDWGSSITNKYGLYDAEEFAHGLLAKINGKAVIDGGGYVGDTPKLWRSLFPQSKIHAFEPSHESFQSMVKLLRKDIEQGSVIANEKGLGEQAGTLSLSMRNDKDAGASFKITANKELVEEVEVVTIDSYVEANNLEVGLIKLDVEGFEPEIVRGALHTIKSQRPLLVIACYHTPEEFYELKGYLESLNLNYRFALRRTSMSIPLADLALIAYPL